MEEGYMINEKIRLLAAVIQNNSCSYYNGNSYYKEEEFKYLKPIILNKVDLYNANAESAKYNANRTKLSDAFTGFVSDLTGGASTIINAIPTTIRAIAIGTGL